MKTCPVLVLRIAAAVVLASCRVTTAADVFVRVKVVEPAGGAFKITLGGYRHAGEPWQFPETSAEAADGAWTPWVDLGKWPWHGRLDREGGTAEWPSMLVSARRAGAGEAVRGCALRVQLADAAGEDHVVHDVTEKSASETIGFLVPTPLREHAKEFETGAQMTARHRAWADEATGNRPIALKGFDLCTSLWGPYDPNLAKQEVETLCRLGFNVIGGTDPDLIARAGARTYRTSDLYLPDPEAADRQWAAGEGRRVANALKTEEGRRELGGVAHWVLADEVRTLDLTGTEAAKRDGWFRECLRARGVTDADLGTPIDQITFPADLIRRKALSREAALPARRLAYHAAKFGQWWSARQLRHGSDLIRAAAPGMKTETLPSDHGFFNAWGPPNIGMSAPMLDLFELGNQNAVDQLSAEDWLGLNHMYGPDSTWTGAQSFEYMASVMRSAIGERPILLRGLITPSDDAFLRLKAYSAMGQGAKSFFFWTYGPTYIGTENYWSDLRSEYDGIAKLGRAIEQAGPVLTTAKPVRDPVAILYSVSHDIWHSDDPAAFVEKRLLWHALRHLHVQPDFLREEDVAAGALGRYKALYVTDWCVSGAATEAIDRWVRGGGVVYLSAGAATRDEFYEPHLAPFARAVWPADAAARLKTERHTYNERTDLPTIQPMARARVRAGGEAFDLPVLGARLDLAAGAPAPFATFDDGSPAAAVVAHGDGKVVGAGFLPMLAYGQLANFKPRTLEEKWPAGPRAIARMPLELAGVKPVAVASEPVVETSLLTGPDGSALVLANYTYQPIRSLTVDLRLADPVARAVSTSGAEVRVREIPGGVRLELPLEWTDIILLTKPQPSK